MLDRRALLTADTSGWPVVRNQDIAYGRLPDVHTEGALDFVQGVEKLNMGAHARAADVQADAILVAAGHEIGAPMTTAQALDLFAHEPIIATRYKAYLDTQRLKMRLVSAALAPHRDHYRDLLDEAASRGPGSLTLDANFVVPDYARHELHMQPGGYVGDELAGYVFHYAIVGIGSGHHLHNETHESIASVVPAPSDGKVRRILELGCGIGQLSTAMKDRFPDAEVWGIDTSAPMLRYAHMTSVGIGAEIHYSQQSAERMDFPDDHFDIITASGLFHEIAPAATRAIIPEVARVLRPGGTFYPLDLYTAGSMKVKEDAKSRFATWISARWYHEDWRNDYAEIDLPREIREAGLQAIENGPGLRLSPVSIPNLMAVKTV